MLEARVATHRRDFEQALPAWDALAVASGQPMSAPAWTLAWLDHLAPAGAETRVVLVGDDGDLVGVVPLVARRDAGCGLWSLAAGDTGRVAPLARSGREWEVAQAAVAALGASEPPLDMLRIDNAPGGAWSLAWELSLRELWRSRRLLPWRRVAVRACPVMELDGTYEAWMSTKSANFRSEMGRARRRFARAGGVVRRATAETLERDVATYLRLHLSRRGEASDLWRVAAGLEAALVAAGADLLPLGRLRLYVLELEGEPIGALLFLAAGGELMLHNVGWDEAHARMKPGLVGLLTAIEEALAAGDRRLDFGPGAYPYKLRFATGDEPVYQTLLAGVGPRMAGIALERAPRAARALAAKVRRARG